MSIEPFPFLTLPRLRSGDVAVQNAAATWLAASPLAASINEGDDGRSPRVLGLELRGWRVVGAARRELDSSAGLAWIQRQGARALVSVPGEVIRPLARRLFAAPAELAAPRPLTAAEQAVTAMLAAAVLTELGAAGAVEPWQPFPDVRAALLTTEQRIAGWACLALAVLVDGREQTAQAWIPPQLAHLRPLSLRGHRRPLPGWATDHLLELPVVVAAAPVPRRALARLAERDVVIVVAPPGGAELRVARGAIALRASPGASHAVIESGYGRAVPPLPDAGEKLPDAAANAAAASPAPSSAPSGAGLAHDLAGSLADDLAVELLVTLGTTALSLRQLADLATGQVIALGRPLAGPFELRVAGKVIGSGELVDVEGSLGVRVTSLRP